VKAQAENDRTRVFLSYAREDLDFLLWLSSALEGKGCLADFDLSVQDPDNVTAGISAEDAWRPRVEEMITSAEVIVFVVSPDSIKSKDCDYEIAFAQRMGKRLIPILCRPINFQQAPPRISALNVKITFIQGNASQIADSLRELTAAIHLDVKWFRTAARLDSIAARWDAAGRAEDRLLRGAELLEAEAWAALRPASAPHSGAILSDFLAVSREESQARERASYRTRVTRSVTLLYLGSALILLPAGLVVLALIKVAAALGHSGFPSHEETLLRSLYLTEVLLYILVVRRRYRISRYGYFRLDGRPCNAGNYAIRWLLIPAGLVMTPLTRCFTDARLTWVDQRTKTELVAIKRDGSRRYAAAAGQPLMRADLARAPNEATTPTGPDQSAQHSGGAAATRRGLTGRRPIAFTSIVLVLAAVATGTGLWLSSSSPSPSAASPPPSGPLKVNTCARTASGSSAPVHIGSIATGAAENDFVDVAFSPDCRVVAAGGNGIVREWDMVTGHRINTLPAVPGGAALIDAFTPNGKAIAVAGGNGYTTLWNAATGRLEARFPSDPFGATYCLVISPDSAEIFTGGSTGVVGIWNVDTRKSVGKITTGDAIGAMALSPNGRLLAVAEYDGIIRVYDTASHAQVATLPGNGTHIWSMAFSPGGSTLVAGGNALEWWDVATDKLIADENNPGGPVTDVAFSPDGTILAAGGYELVGLWDAHTRRLVITLGLGADGTSGSSSYPNGMSFNRYGAILAFGFGGTLQFWNVADVSGPAQ
jgi:hypothetical protein